MLGIGFCTLHLLLTNSCLFLKWLSGFIYRSMWVVQPDKDQETNSINSSSTNWCIRWYFFLFFCWINSLLDRFIQVRYLWDYDYSFMGHPFPWLDCFLLITCVECNSKFLWIDSSSSFVLSFRRLSLIWKRWNNNHICQQKLHFHLSWKHLSQIKSWSMEMVVLKCQLLPAKVRSQG